MRDVYDFTARTLKPPSRPFGALIVNTRTGERLMRATNAVMRGERSQLRTAKRRTVRLACKKLKRPSLAGYTMYSTCEPCAMCMANALWARLDRVVYGATIADASRHFLQIHIPAEGSGAPLGHALRRGRPGAARTVQHAFHASEYAESVSHWSTSKKTSARKRDCGQSESHVNGIRATPPRSPPCSATKRA